MKLMTGKRRKQFAERSMLYAMTLMYWSMKKNGTEATRKLMKRCCNQRVLDAVFANDEEIMKGLLNMVVCLEETKNCLK
jgi:hypothetical protein